MAFQERGKEKALFARHPDWAVQQVRVAAREVRAAVGSEQFGYGAVFRGLGNVDYAVAFADDARL